MAISRAYVEMGRETGADYLILVDYQQPRGWERKKNNRTRDVLVVSDYFCGLVSHPFKAGWHDKTNFTFSDTIAAVRTRIWLDGIFQTSPADRERPEIPMPETPKSLVCGLIDQNSLPMVPPRPVQKS